MKISLLNKSLYLLLSLSLFIGLYFGEDSSGSGGHIADFNSTWGYVEALKNAIFVLPSKWALHTPLHYIILSKIYIFIESKYIIRIIFCIFSIIACIYCLSKAMTIIPVGFTYATYGGLTITAVTIFGIFKYNQTPNIYGILGIFLIIIGVILLNTMGKTN